MALITDIRHDAKTRSIITKPNYKKFNYYNINSYVKLLAYVFKMKYGSVTNICNLLRINDTFLYKEIQNNSNIKTELLYSYKVIYSDLMAKLVELSLRGDFKSLSYLHGFLNKYDMDSENNVDKNINEILTIKFIENDE